MQHLIADVLIPGRGDPIENAAVVIEGGIIVYAGPAASAPARDSETTVTEVNTVMPGLWDCHSHFVGMPVPNLGLLGSSDPVTCAVRSVADIGAMLNAGITSAREVGGMGLSIASTIEDGSVSGPWTYAAGRILSTTGGHADIHELPLEVVHDIGCRFGFSILCDGVPEVLKAVRTNLRKNARLIKVCASGGVMSEVDHPQHQQFSDEELAAIVQEATRAERIVAAHCHGKAGIMAALRAGCHTIEHGSFIDEEAADRMVEQDAMFVPTRFVVESLLGQLELLQPYAQVKGKMVAEAHREAMAIAIEKGVRIATGCDIFVSGQMYGENSREIEHLIDAGMTDLQAIEAATANGPETLGPQAPKSGQLLAGYDADVIALDTNPLEDRSVWGHPDRVTHVLQRGMVRKQPAA